MNINIYRAPMMKNGNAQSRLLKDAFRLSGESVPLDEFCMDENIRLPQMPIRHLLCPALPEEAGLFYYLSCFDREAQTLDLDQTMEMGGMSHG